MENDRFEKLKVHGFNVLQSLRRSTVRIKILNYLNQTHGKATIAEISESISQSYTNVKLAIFGDDLRYRKNRSLINVGLVSVEDINGSGSNIIILTHKGREVAGSLEELGNVRDE
jgi:predicted transcriptional regulator with HTH domain